MYHIRFKKRIKLCKHYDGMKGDDSSAYTEVKTEAKLTREGLKKKGYTGWLITKTTK
jgi:hypothetical protein